MIFILYYLLHMKMKKLLVGAFLGMFTLAGVAVLPNYASAQTFSSDDPTDFEGQGYEWWDKQDTQYNAGVRGSDNLQRDSLIKTIQTAINWVLGILSLVALVLCLWGGFLMMTSGGDSKKYEKWVGILKWAGIGLAIIALSWLIVSLIFYVINGSIRTDGEGGASQQWQVNP